MKESITDRYIGIGAGVGVALGFILKIALDSLAGLALGIFFRLVWRIHGGGYQADESKKQYR